MSAHNCNYMAEEERRAGREKDTKEDRKRNEAPDELESPDNEEIGTREQMIEQNRQRLRTINELGEDLFANQKSALIDKWKSDEILEDNFLEDAFKDARREYFIDKKNAPYSYYEQEISIDDDIVAPEISTVIDILELAQIKPGMSILLLGCSSGYEEELLLKLRCNVDVLEGNMKSIDYARAKLEVLYDDDKIPAYFTRLGELNKKYDRVIGFKSVPKLRKQLFGLVDKGRMVLCLGDEKVLVTLDFDGSSHPLMKFIGSLWLPPLGLDVLEIDE